MRSIFRRAKLVGLDMTPMSKNGSAGGDVGAASSCASSMLGMLAPGVLATSDTAVAGMMVTGRRSVRDEAVP